TPNISLVACKVVMAANPDPNAALENTQWATENSMMVCQWHEVDLYDPGEGMQINQADNPARAQPKLRRPWAMRARRHHVGGRLGSGTRQHALARVAHRLPGANRRSQDRNDDRLQAARMRAPRHGGVPDRLGNLGQPLFNQDGAEVIHVSER